ncbi:hypothetical protein U8527_01680 [Kordia algicida OT-1]|uniref:Tissue inhibitor of metalloproteinase n=1 Tax=Kordia algicida OT-1 TaxID=391587 RepID=A9DT16_9FLAO|nr:hypothetical protein [Kordia algicida]EDP97011.1 hypothetical protein KAOT1_17648 [Kordia algicida OT-1]
MKHFIVALFLLFTSYLFACDCDAKKPILEFYNAEFVFEGEIVSKVYAEDAQTYTVRFVITKHYKDGEKPEELSFVLKSEELYTDISTLCDWNVEVRERWLVYAHRNKKGALNFSYYCSNSKKPDFSAIGENEQEVLENGNDFILENYIYENENGFTNPKPLTDVAAVLKSGKKDNYENTFAVIKIHVDKEGYLKAVTTDRDYNALKIDKIFDLLYSFTVDENMAVSNFEKEAIRLSKKIYKWEIKYHKKSNIPVSYIKPVIFQYDKKNHTWSYEF